MGKHLSASLGGVIAALLTACAAAAHEWYDRECCNTFDCAPVPVSTVTTGPEGYTVTLRPGDHPFVKEARSYSVPYGSKKDRVSQDNDYHACVSKASQTLFCLYSPKMGF